MAQSDNIPAMLQSGEYVVRKEAVDELGKDTMDMINNADRLGYAGGGLVPQGEHGHSAIDELLALNTLANQKSVDMTRDSAMMNKGGKVALPGIPGEYVSKKSKREPNPMSLGLMGSLLSRAFLSDGELVPNYGEFNRLLMNNPEPGDRLTPEEMILKELLGMKDGGMMDNYMYGGMSKKKKKKGYDDGGSIGAVNEIGKSRKMFSELDEILQTAALMDRYDFGSSQRGALSALREADVVDPKEAVQQVMMLLKARQGNKIPSFEKRKSYIMGGSAGAGSGSGFEQPATSDYFQEIYDTFGFIPSDAGIKADFESRFAYDPTKAVGEIGGLTKQATGALSDVIQQTEGQGIGFEDFGGRERTTEKARSNLYRTLGEEAEGISTEFKQEQQEEALVDLARREESGAEFDTTRTGPPQMPSGFTLAGTTREMADGTYIWAGNRWVGPS